MRKSRTIQQQRVIRTTLRAIKLRDAVAVNTRPVSFLMTGSPDARGVSMCLLSSGFAEIREESGRTLLVPLTNVLWMEAEKTPRATSSVRVAEMLTRPETEVAPLSGK